MQFYRKTPIGIGIPDFLFSPTKERRKQIEKQSTPVIFDIAYTPYKLPKNATPRELETHRKNRAFFDLSGKDNIYKYMTTEGKVYGNEAERFTMLQYLQKSTGVFNQEGLLSKEQVKEIKKRARTGEKNLWHGFISFNEEDSKLIDTPEKCIDLVKKTFRQFFKGAGFDPDNMDLLCALHLDRPKHLHIHYLFFEKEPKIKNQRAAGYLYRKKGKISFDAIEKMTERLNAFTLDDELEEKRQAVHDALLNDHAYSEAVINDMTRKLLEELADKLPRDKPLWYASKEMAPYRSEIDNVAGWLLTCSQEASDADEAFKSELKKRQRLLRDKMGAWYKERADKELHIVQNMEGYTELGDGMKNLCTIEAIEWDYRRRIGNIVLRHVRDIQKETFQPNPKRHYKTNDKALKRNLTISARKIRRLNDGFFAAVGELFTPQATIRRNRLQEIEAEMEEEQKKEEAKEQAEEERIRQEAIRRSKYSWSK